MKLCFTLNRERVGFRSPYASLVLYPRRGYVEAWLGKLGAMRLLGQWFFTRNGQFIFAGGIPPAKSY